MKAVLILVVGLVIGAGVVLLVSQAAKTPRADPDDLAVICTEHLTKCWQGGKPVQQPRDNEPCVGPQGAGFWRSGMPGTTVRSGFMYLCDEGGE